jgi:hypothetical protein
MAKKGQHEESGINPQKPRGHEQSRGNNNPSKSVTITTGTYKKPETFEKQANEHKDPHRGPQWQKNERDADVREEPSNQGSTRYGGNETAHRSGSQSNASR